MHHYLLIDDDTIFNFIHSEVIKKVEPDAMVSMFNSAKDGLKFLQEKIEQSQMLPDVLFLDIRMPELDGFAILDELSKYPIASLQGMHIYMLTSSLDDRDRMKALKSELVKGFKSKTLTATMLIEILEELTKNKPKAK